MFAIDEIWVDFHITQIKTSLKIIDIPELLKTLKYLKKYKMNYDIDKIANKTI
jgi:hypothetical protein